MKKIAFLSAATALACASAANTLNWDGSLTGASGGGNGIWDANTTAGWWNGSSDVKWTDTTGTDTAIFGNTAGTVSISGDVTANALTFNTTGYLLTGGTLTLAGTTPSITTGTGFTNTVGSVIAGSDLTTSGAGTLVLTGANTYTGTTTVGAGTLQLGDGTSGHDGTLATASVSVGAAGTLAYDIAGTQTVTYGITGSAGATLVKDGAGTLTLNNTGAVGFGSNGSTLKVNNGRLVYTGLANNTGLYQTSIQIASGAVLEMNVTSGASNNFGAWNSAYSGGGTLYKSGAGTLTFGTYAGGRTVGFGTGALIWVNAGTLIGNDPAYAVANWTNNKASLQVDSGATFNANGGTILVDALIGAGAVTLGSGSLTVGVAGGGDTFSGTISGTGSFIKTGAGTQILSAANTFSGTTTVNAGTLNLSHASALQNSVFSGGAGNLVFDASVATHAFTFGGLGGSTTLVLADNATTPDAVALTVGNNNTTAAYSGALSGAGSLTKIGTGVQSLSGANTYAGVTTVNGGTLDFVNAASFYGSASGGVTGTNAAKLVVNSGAIAAFGVGGTGRFTSADIDTLLNSSTASVGFLAGSSIGIDTTNAPGGNLIYSSAITDANSGANAIGFAKIGTGTLTLAGANSYTGVTSINGGTLALGGAGVLSSTSSIGFGGGALQYSATNTTDYSSKIANSAGAIAIDTNGQNIVFASALATSNTGGLTKLGSGTLTLSATNAYTGMTTVSADTLVFAPTINSGSNITIIPGSATIASGATLKLDFTNVKNGGTGYAFVLLNGGSGTTTINAGGTLELYADATHKMNGTAVLFAAGGASISGAGTIKKTGQGAVDFWNAGPGAGFTGMIDVEDGVLTFQQSGGTNGQFSGKSTLSIAAPATVDVRGGFNPYVDVLTGSGVLGSSTAVNTLTVGNNNGSGSFLGIIADGPAITLPRNGMTSGWNGTIAFVKNGTGTQTLSGANAYSGATTVNAGTLDFVNAASFYGSASGGVTGTKAAKLIVKNGATAAFGVGGAGQFTSADIDTLLNASTASVGFLSGSSIGIDTTNAPGGAYTYSSAITNANSGANAIGLAKIGAGMLSLAGPNSYTGTTSVNSGTLEFVNASSFYGSTGGSVTGANAAKLVVKSGAVAAFGVGGTGRFTSADIATLLGSSTASVGFLAGSSIGIDTTNAPGGNLTYSSAITNTNSGSNAIGLTKLGSGTLTLSAVNTYTGMTTVATDTLVFAPMVNSGSNTTIIPGSATIADGATLKLDFTNVKNGATYPTVLLNGGSGTTTINAGGTLELYADATHKMNGTAVLFAAGGASISGAGTIKKTGQGAVDFWNAGPGSGFTGMIDVEDGVLTFQQPSSQFSGKSLLSIATPATVDVRGGGVINLFVDALTGTGVVGSSANANTLTVGNNGGSGTFSGIIADGLKISAAPLRNGMTTGWTGTLALVKNGTGTQTLSGANAYSGGTTINGGVLAVGNATALGTGAVLLAGGTITTSVGNVGTVNGFTMNNATSELTMNGASAGSITLTANANLLLSAGKWNIDLANGADRFIGSGTGKFTLSGSTIDLGGGAIDYGVGYTLISGFTAATSSSAGVTIMGYDNANWAAALSDAGVLTFTAVPEPSTYGLLGAGALAAIAFVRRRRFRG